MSQDPQRTDPLAPTVSVDVAPRTSTSEPSLLRVHVRNVTDFTQDFIVRLRGLESSWIPAPAALPGVAPDATVTFDLPITPAAGTLAGEYPFVVEVEARTLTKADPAGQAGSAAGTLDGLPGTSDGSSGAFGGSSGTIARSIVPASWQVDALSDLVLSVEPADARGLLRRTVKVQVANSGNQPRDIVLDTTSERGLFVRLSGKRVSVAPQQSAHLKARLRANKVQLLHSSPRRSFTIIATGNQTPTRFQGTFQSRALLPSGVMRALSLILVIAMWAGGTVIALPWLSQRFNADRVVTETATRNQDPEQEGSDAPGPGGANGNQSGDDSEPNAPSGGDQKSADDPESDDDSSEIEQVRIAGAVTGVSPEGVTVNIRPASAVAGDPAATDSSNTNAAAVRSVTNRLSQSPALSVGRAAWQLVTHTDLGSGSKTAALPATRKAPAGKTWREALPVERSTSTPQTRSTVTSGDGTWAFGGMDPNTRYLVTLSKPGFQTVRYFVTGAEVAQVPLEVSLEAGQGTISGQVTGPNGAAGGVEITLTDGTTTLSTRTATSGDIGSWSVTGLSAPSTYLVTAAGSGLGAQSRLIDLGADGSQTIDMTLRRGVASLRGTISGPNSRGTFAPLGSMTVTAQGEGITRTATTSTAPTNGGAFILPDLPVPGKYTVTVSGEGYLTQIREISLNTRKASRALNLQLQRAGGTVVGTVKDEDGSGLTGAGMILTSDDNTYKTMSASDGAGGFRFDGITAGTYVLSGQIFGHETAFAQVKVIDGRVHTSDLVLTSIDGNGLTATSRIRGRAVDATTGASITCPHKRGNEVCAVTVTTEATDKDGNVSTISTTQMPDAQYTLPTTSGLYPGRYTLTFEAPGYEPTTVDVEVAMNTVVEAATAALYPSPSISGNILTRVGALPPNTCVVATTGDAATPTGHPCVTASDGECTVTGATETYCAFVDAAAMGGYSINRLPSGTYQVRTFVPSGTEYVSDEVGVALSLQGGDAKRYDATLDRLGRLSITALRSTRSGSLVAGAGAKITAVSTGNVTFSKEGTATESGYLLLTGLPDSVYTVTAEDASNHLLTGRSTGITLGLNQEISVQLVITSDVDDLEGTVIAQLEAVASDPVANASVTVTGVVGYSGVVPVRDTVTVPATNSQGKFTICTDLDCATEPHERYLPLVEENVDIQVTATNYVTFSRNNVPVSELTTITLDPLGVRFDGKLTLQGATASELDSLNPKASFTVISAPPGTGAMSLAADANGRVKWTDSLQPLHADGGRTIRPGKYVVRVSLPGFDTQERDFEVGIGDTVASPEFVLRKYGQLRVFAMAPVSGGTFVAQEAPTMEIQLLDGTTRVVDAPGSRSYVDFGSLPSGEYRVTAWLPGFAETSAQLTVSPGQIVADDPTPSTRIVLRPLGTATGVVYSQYKPNWKSELANATVTAEHDRSDAAFAGTTDGEGKYRITGTKAREGLRQGDWTLEAKAAGHKNTELAGMLPSSRTVPIAEPTFIDDPISSFDLAVTPRPARIQVTVIDPKNTAIAITEGLTLRLDYDDGLNSVETQTATRCNPDAANDPSFCFVELLPLTYTLTVSADGYAPVSTNVSVAAGSTRQLRVPMTNPDGSVQGLITEQIGSQVTAVEGATVTLEPLACGETTDEDDNDGSGDGDGAENESGGSAEIPICVRETDDNGTFLFDAVPAGTYTLTATYQGGEAKRLIVVGIAQSLFIDLLIVQPTSSVTVQARSVNGFDLTGGLVSLTGSATLSPQPLVRSDTDSNLYSAHFAQVPYGNFTAHLNGPTGHLGTHTVDDVGVSADNPNPEVLFDVTETRVHLFGALESSLASQTQIPGLPQTILGKIGGLPEIPIPVGDSVVVYVPTPGSDSGVPSYPISGTAGLWKVTRTSGAAEIPIDAVTFTATLTISRHIVNLTLDPPSPNPVTVDSAVTWNFTISSGSDIAVTGGTLSLQRQVNGTWTNMGAPLTLPESGTGSVSYSAELPAGSSDFRLSYSGAPEFTQSDSNPQPLMIDLKPTGVTVQSPSPGHVVATLTPTEAASSVASGGSQLVIQTQGNGGAWNDVAASSCNRSNEVLTCNGLTEGAQARAVFRIVDPSNNPWKASESTEVPVTVTPPPPDPGNGG